MNSIWHALLWKEGREQRWKIIILLVAACLLQLILLYDAEGGFAESFIIFSVIVAAPLVCMFIGAGIAAGEQSQQTIGFLQSLPINARRAAIAKLLVALVTAWAPCLLMIANLWVWRWWQGFPDLAQSVVNSPEMIVVAYGLTGSSLLIWMASAGVNRKDEVQASAIGVLVMLVCWAPLMLLWNGQIGSDDNVWNRLGFAAAPAGVMTIFIQWVHQSHLNLQGVEPPSLSPPIIVAVVTHGVLVAWYVLRFGRVIHGRLQTVETLTRRTDEVWLKPPRTHPWTAILWKQARESMPLAALGAGAIFCVAIIIATAVSRKSGEFGEEIAFAAVRIWIVAGFLVSVVTGIGLLMDDLRPGLYGFWRSRPINVDQWFAVKFTVSLLTTVLTLALPTLIIYGGVVALSGVDASLESLMWIDDRIWVIATVGLLVQISAFSVAAAAMAFTRQPVTAAVVVILTAICVGFFSEEYATTGKPVVAFIAVAAMTATIAAWLAVRNNWGWKH